MNVEKYPSISTERLMLRAPTLADREKLKDFDDRNREHLIAWETLSKEPLESRLHNQLKKSKKDERSVIGIFQS